MRGPFVFAQGWYHSALSGARSGFNNDQKELLNMRDPSTKVRFICSLLSGSGKSCFSNRRVLVEAVLGAPKCL